RWCRDHANGLRLLPRSFGSRGAVVADVDRAETFHGAHAVRDGHSHHSYAADDELLAGVARATHPYICGLRAAGLNVCRRRIFRLAGATVARSELTVY